MTSQVNWAVLGLVIKAPGYGYELVRRFEREYEPLLLLNSPSHVYSALRILAERRMIEEAAVLGGPSSRGGSEPRPGYRPTREGRESYRGWLLGRIEDSRRDSMLLARLLGVLAGEPAEALGLIEHYRRALLAQAPRGRSGFAWREPAEHADAGSRLVGHLVEEDERLETARMLDWLDFAQREFEVLASERG